MKVWIISIFCLLSAYVSCQTSNDSSWIQRINQIIEKQLIENGPGGVVAVAKGHQLLYSKAFGYANVESQKLNTPHTLFDIASCSKQFTAASILRLAEQGKIDLKQPIQDYFPELKIKHPIPIHTLLSHTSGLFDYSELLLLARGREGMSEFSKKEIINIIFNQTELSFLPLTNENYSNSNFAILAELVERVSKQSFPAFVRSQILAPLDISPNEISFINYNNDSNTIQATGYPQRKEGQVEFLPEVKSNKAFLYGAGGMKANIFGLHKWMSHYNSGVLFNGTPLIDLLLQKDSLQDGKLSHYARGLESGTTKEGYQWVQHTGRSHSTSIMLWFPEYKVSIIALMNTQEIWAQSVTNKFYNDVLTAMAAPSRKDTISSVPEEVDASNTPTTSIIPQNAIELSVDELRKFVGTFRADAPVGSHVPPSGGVGVDKIILKDGKLQYVLYNGYTIDLKPVGKDLLEMTGIGRPVQLHFSNLNTEQTGIRFADPFVNNGIPSEEVTYKIPKTTPPELEKYCGKFAIPTISNSIPIEIMSEEGVLYMQWGILKKRSQLYYLGNDILTSWQSGNAGMQCNLVFKRSTNHEIMGFHYDGHRIWNLYLEKL